MKRALRVHLVSLGCARTLVDSEVALGGLARDGYHIVKNLSETDVAIVNTCGFIEEAKTESIDTILALCELKKKGKLKAVVVLGCLAQRHGEALREDISEVDAIIGTNNFGDLARVLEPIQARQKVYRVEPRPYYLLNENTPRVSLTPGHYAYVKISEGCINACSYCAIPKMKGPHRSRTIESILNEIRKISSERKLSEINLVGQDTAAFGIDTDKKFLLPELLRAVQDLNAVPWVRLLYAHPGHVTEEIIDAIADSPTICKYVDFPIEHSHDDMLARMNRGVTRDRMLWGIERMRKKMPFVTLRTTVIVGFPGETEEEFRDLMDFLKDVRFERLGAFRFSDEEGTRAHGMANPVSKKISQERYDAVMSQQRTISREQNERLLGKTISVLIDEEDPDEPGVYLGRTQADAPDVDGQVRVHPAGQRLSAGRIVPVHVDDALEYDLIGTLA